MGDVILQLTHDPGAGETFWSAIKAIPGYPQDEVETPIRYMVFESDALFRLSEALTLVGADPTRSVLVVMDPTPMKRAQGQLKPWVIEVLRNAGWRPERLVLEPDITGQVHTDMNQIGVVKERLKPGMSVVSVGSGTITDISKHACFQYQAETSQHVPMVVFQTANSVSAYTSNMAPVYVNKVKRTLPSRYPDALVADLETLRDAPREMTIAGLGDLLAAFVSLPDWYLAQRLGMDSSYTSLPETLMGPLDEILSTWADDIREGSLHGMAMLAKLIALGGLAMSLARATAPLSGYEHVISHMLDLQAEMANRPLAQHGTQVALAAILGTDSYRRLLSEFEPDEVDLAMAYPSSGIMQARIEEVFADLDPSGKVSTECWSDYKEKLEKWHAHRAEFEIFLQEWSTIKAAVEQRTRAPERIAAILRDVDSPLRFDDLNPPFRQDEVKFAFLNAPLMRKRFSVGDLFIFLAWDRERLWQQAWETGQNVGVKS